MYFVLLQDHLVSVWFFCRGAPTECKAATNSLLFCVMVFSTLLPMRDMMYMEATTYSLSVISTPNLGFGAFRCPITKGIMYMVRPFIQFL